MNCKIKMGVGQGNIIWCVVVFIVIIWVKYGVFFFGDCLDDENVYFSLKALVAVPLENLKSFLFLFSQDLFFYSSFTVLLPRIGLIGSGNDLCQCT